VGEFLYRAPCVVFWRCCELGEGNLKAGTHDVDVGYARLDRFRVNLGSIGLNLEIY